MSLNAPSVAMLSLLLQYVTPLGLRPTCEILLCRKDAVSDLTGMLQGSLTLTIIGLPEKGLLLFRHMPHLLGSSSIAHEGLLCLLSQEVKWSGPNLPLSSATLGSMDFKEGGSYKSQPIDPRSCALLHQFFLISF